jgi:hypothetical protein
MLNETFQDILSAGGVLPPAHSHEGVSSRAPPLKSRSEREGAHRFETLNRFIDSSARSVSVTAQAAWTVLYRDVKPSGRACIAQTQVAECMGVSRRTACRALKELENAGLISVVKRGGLNRGANVYRVHGTPARVPPVTPVTSATADTFPRINTDTN